LIPHSVTYLGNFVLLTPLQNKQTNKQTKKPGYSILVPSSGFLGKLTEYIYITMIIMKIK
jgi:hypothetical protein